MADASTSLPDDLSGGIIGADIAHDSAEKHVSGRALYIDDMPEPRGLLHVALGLSTRAHAKIVKLDLSAVRAAPGVVVVLTEKDVPGKNDVSPIAGDDPLFANHEALYHGQALFAVAAETRAAARAAMRLAKVEYEDLPALLDIAAAREAKSTIEDAKTFRMGDAAAALKAAPCRLKSRIVIGGQDHFYLEGQIAMATLGEDGDVTVYSSTQNPSETQHVVGRVLGLQSHQVICEVRRMGGGFGGKETQSMQIAAAAALVARLTGRPAKLRLDRDDDMVLTGKRHDFEADYEVGFDDAGRLHAVDLELASRCGYSADLSMAINDRAMFHSDNAYFLNAAHILSHRFRTHTVSNTAFRGFGGPQGMIAIERVMDEIAIAIGRDPLDVRKANLYAPGRDTTPYGQQVEEHIIAPMIDALEKSSNYRERREAIKTWNAGNTHIKRGLSLTPVKFGISFTATHLNQAGALVHVYSDGTIQLNHGGTEMGQGLYVKVAQVVAAEFAVPLSTIRIMPTSTAKVPNTSATAASAGTDLNGMAAREAARTIKNRLIDFAARLWECDEAEIVFSGGRVRAGDREMSFADLAHAAYMARVSLSATGYYRTPKIGWDRAAGRGRPFFYYTYGCAVSEAAIDTLTGENRILRVDILHDCGRSLNPAIDLGQIEGGFIQGMGWLTTEELWFDAKGALRTHAPSTYKIPTAGDRPDMRIALWNAENPEEAIYRSKAVGEPPLMLAISAFCAIADAVAAVGEHKTPPHLDAPATPERVLAAVQRLKGAP
ncbi:MAG TPA: xanthine dehydrogenase molybdopterin binding subunit [Hyphomonadaceae bacterium]|jgi:xanthine dehydrogenase large subunit|nr:xanthine dehydrogenase molybdopterin binding subunit [Hyphomonadaceae bacterium]